MNAALSGFRVLDLTSYLAGPYGCALLGDMGAEIIKVEAPGGDMMRQYPSSLEGECRTFLGANRNKRSIVINLKTADGRAVLDRMVEGADVLIHNFRPGVGEALGIGYDRLCGINPSIIYCALTGYGQSGPMRDHPGYDQMLQCFTGIATFQGESRETPEILRGSIVDFYSSTLIAYGVATALVHRLRTGAGQRLDLSLLRSAIALQAGRFVWAEGEGRDVSREPASGRVTGALPTRDGYLYVQASTPPFWRQLCDVLDLPHLAADPRYDTVKKRFVLAEEIMPQIRAALLKRSALEWESLMIGKVPCVAVRAIEDMFDHPQVVDQGLVTEHDHPIVGRYRTMTTAIGTSLGQVATTRAPLIGEHSDAILAELGFDEAAVDALREAGAVA